ncbi:MAG: amidohydrolase [Firmicutes bacterium]|nr:amidohydrolase [Bacillota bacterium]
MELTKDALMPLIERAYDRAVSIRNDLHMHPELSEEEVRTSQVIADTLRALGIETRENIAGHGVIGTIYGRDRTRAVGIRADIDALPITEELASPICSLNPGVMHACGHDMHTAILLGTAMVLNEIRDELPLSVRLIFQPAEETTGGALPMIQEGILNDIQVDRVIGLHVEPRHETGVVEFIPGVMNAAITDFDITVNGKSCHGAHPDKGIDPIPCACDMVLSYQTILTRRLDPASGALITTGSFHSGTANNVISDKAELIGTIRTLETEDMELIKREFPAMIDSIAKAYGCTADIKLRDSYPNLKCDTDLLDILIKTCEGLLGKEKVVINPVSSLGGDDFSYFCHHARGCYYNLGCHRPGDEKVYSLHSSVFDPDEKCMLTGILTEVMSAIELMNN